MTTILSPVKKMSWKGELSELEERLADSNVEIHPALKKRVYEILWGVQQGARRGEYDMPGMLVVLGYEHGGKFYSEPDHDQNVFQDKPHVINDETAEMMADTREFDGAILVDPTGYVTDSGIYLAGLNPAEVLDHMGIPNHRDLSTRFGFFDKVHARHLTAISASHELPGTTTYTLSEERGVLRMFEGGRILYSQIPQEMQTLAVPSMPEALHPVGRG